MEFSFMFMLLLIMPLTFSHENHL